MDGWRMDGAGATDGGRAQGVWGGGERRVGELVRARSQSVRELRNAPQRRSYKPRALLTSISSLSRAPSSHAQRGNRTSGKVF